jgi:guanine nucleotide-binding protein subunit alpha
MRLIHHQPFTTEEIEFYRQLVFHNLTHGLQNVLEAADHLELALSSEKDAQAIEDAPDIKDGEPFPMEYKGVLQRMWRDESVQAAIARGNEFALPEK